MMLCFIQIVFCFLVLFDVQILCQEVQKCNGEVALCVQKSTNFSQFYISSPSNETDKKNTRRKHTSHVHRKRKSSNRRKSFQRKSHRHSTRVLSLKPAVVLLPPFENDFQERNVSTLNPFIINILANSKTSTSFEDFEFILPLPEQVHPLNKPLPNVALVTEREQNPIITRDSNVPLVTNQEQNPNPIVPSSDFPLFPDIDQTPIIVPFSNVEAAGTPINEIEAVNTVLPPFRYLVPPFPEDRNNVLGSQQLEKSENYQFPEVPAPDFVETSSSFFNYQFPETSSFPTSLPNGEVVTVPQEVSNQTGSYDNYSFSPFETTLQPVSDYFSNTTVTNTFTDRGYGQDRNSYNSFNNTLLAPEVASLGMKIVTSKKGLEMMKELTTIGKPTNEHQQNEGSHSILETAESGDIRLHTYNQILSIEDAKDVSKDVYKALKKTHKPFEVCNVSQGYVADPSSGCQVFYICLGSGAGEPMMCPNGTLFNQEVLVCDWWYNVECSG